MDFSHLIEEYILSKKMAWAPTTLKTEKSRLRAHIVNLSEEPGVLYERLSKTMKPAALKTTFIRLGEFHQWAMESGRIALKPNPFKDFMKTNARLFKHSYQPERLGITFKEAMKRIESIEDESMKQAALQLLEGGLRFCELKTLDGERVIGKGSKPREIFLRRDLKNFRFEGTYAQLHWALKQVGLKPHTLRKLCATEFANQEGVSDVDIMEAFGWNSIETSSKYRQPQTSEKRAVLFKKAVGK